MIFHPEIQGVVVNDQIKVKSLRHVFTQEEIRDMHDNIVKSVEEVVKLESEKKTVTTRIGAALESEKGIINRSANLISNGFEYRNMQCRVSFDWDKGVKCVVHPETARLSRRWQ